MPLDQILARVHGYDVIGLSSNTINIESALQLVSRIAASIRPKPLIVLGGHHATFMHEEIITQNPTIEAIVRGEGEYALEALCLDYFANSSLTYPHEGVSFRYADGRLHLTNTINNIDDLDQLPFPIRDRQDYYSRGHLHGDHWLYVPVSSSRGCPYGCSFCTVTGVRRDWKGRSPENVAREVVELYANRADTFLVFIDDNFYINPKRALEITRLIYQEINGIFKFSFATRADQILKGGRHNLEVLKNVGCKFIELGIENGSLSMLNRLNKGITPEESIAAIELVKSVGIKPVIDFIMYDPWTTIGELQENVQFIRKAGIYGHNPPVHFNKLEMYPGTKFYRQISAEHYFVNLEVEIIYECMKRFSQSIIYKNTMETMSKFDSMEKTGKWQIYIPIYLRCAKLPYVLFESIVNAAIEGNDINSHYETIINQYERRISDYLCMLETGNMVYPSDNYTKGTKSGGC